MKSVFLVSILFLLLAGCGNKEKKTESAVPPTEQSERSKEPPLPYMQPTLRDLAAAVVEAVAPVYPYRHAVLLQQTRRMRSGEVNYIDHPMLGAIIKFTPVTAEQLAAIAQEQATTLPDDAQAL